MPISVFNTDWFLVTPTGLSPYNSLMGNNPRRALELVEKGKLIAKFGGRRIEKDEILHFLNEEIKKREKEEKVNFFRRMTRVGR